MRPSTNSDSAAYHPEEQSLLEDASTLLMFSKSNHGGGRATRAAGAEQQRQAAGSTREGSGEPPASADAPLKSPGPALVALLEPEPASAAGDSSRRHSRTSSTSSSASNKGKVAAAALAAAAEVPFPVKRTRDEAQRPDRQRQSSLSSVKSESRGSWSAREEWPVSDSYIVDPDEGIITCVCGYNDDDGFTIQCDHCYRWQHATCYGIEDESAAPDDFLCKVCSPRNIDVKAAKRKQQERIKNNRRRRRGASAEDKPVKEHSAGAIDTPASEGNDVSNTTPVSHSPSVAAAELSNKQPFMNAKEAYPAVYLPLDTYDIKDKYVVMFLDRHSDDDWVTPYNKRTFKPLPLEIRAYSEPSHSRVFHGFPKLGVYSQQPCAKDTLIAEFLGEVDFQRKYLEDPRNNYRLLGIPNPKVLFHPHWPIYIDARLCGNLTRYLRRSCYPNVELVTIKMPADDRQASDVKTNKSVKFVLKALRDLERGEELHIKWDWDLRHPIWRVINGAAVESIAEPEKYLLIHSVDTVLSICDCACGSNNRDCHLLKVKKFSQTLYRSVKSKMNNRYKLNEILQKGKVQNRRQTPILSSLAHEAITNSARAHEVLVKLNATKLNFLSSRGKGERNTSFMVTKPPSSLKPETVDSGHKPLNGNAKDAQPYKWRLLGKYLEQRASSVLSGSPIKLLSSPANYSETNITDLQALAIPVEVQISASAPKPAPSVDLPRPSSERSDTPVANVPTSVEATAHHVPVSVSPLAEAVSVGAVVNAVAGPAAANAGSGVQNSKKKLSFADYKKKVKPT
ncbi:FAFR077Wp [Eremothecium gossypii FDAG1]|nr:FAFR077Wp [Eremothecium gossypii FDAG1]